MEQNQSPLQDGQKVSYSKEQIKEMAIARKSWYLEQLPLLRANVEYAQARADIAEAELKELTCNTQKEGLLAELQRMETEYNAAAEKAQQDASEVKKDNNLKPEDNGDSK